MIHHFDGSHWLPGPDHRDGSQPFPPHPKAGTFFNDVTGAAGTSADAVQERLFAMLMKQSALAAIMPMRCDLDALLMHIADSSPPATQGPVDRLITEVLLGADESLHVKPSGAWPLALAKDLASFALALVRANGQMAYIRRQPWYRAGRHVVMLRVESEFDRPLEGLQWHKDTEGDVLFSNLVFQNRPGMLATEWTPDLQPMPPNKRALLAKVWPPALLDEIDAARQQLIQLGEHAMSIEGGTLEKNGVISWVDELVWHSSPMVAHRLRWTADSVAEVMGDEGFDGDTYDIMVQIARKPGGRFAHWLADHGHPLEALSAGVAQTLWREAHADPAQRPVLDALKSDALEMDWSRGPMQTSLGMSLIQNLPDGQGQAILMQPSGIEGRPRSNSGQMDALASSQATKQPRDFIQVIVAVRPRQ